METANFAKDFFRTFTGESFYCNDGKPRSPQSIDFAFAKALREYCVPFLRRASLLLMSVGLADALPEPLMGQLPSYPDDVSLNTLPDEYYSSFFQDKHLSPEHLQFIAEMKANGLKSPLSDIDRTDNFVALLDYLKIPHLPCFFVQLHSQSKVPAEKKPGQIFLVENLLHRWLHGTFHCSFLGSELAHFTTVERTVPFNFIALPEDYNTVLHRAMTTPCFKCHTIPNNPALCLTCGRFLCSFSNCCVTYSGTGDHVGEVAAHSYCCCSVGAFLMVKRCVVIITAPDKGIYMKEFGTLYLDCHGEADPELLRGKPLTLSKIHYRALRNLLVRLRAEDYCAKDNPHGRDPTMMLI
jgi:hypothetical protein